jgi:hypothetical protein
MAPLADNLADNPIFEAWDGFSKAMLGADAPRELTCLFEQAFYAGAAMLWWRMMHAPKDTAAMKELMGQIDREIKEYVCARAAERAGKEPN